MVSTIHSMSCLHLVQILFSPASFCYFCNQTERILQPSHRKGRRVSRVHIRNKEILQEPWIENENNKNIQTSSIWCTVAGVQCALNNTHSYKRKHRQSINKQKLSNVVAFFIFSAKQQQQKHQYKQWGSCWMRSWVKRVSGLAVVCVVWCDESQTSHINWKQLKKTTAHNINSELGGDWKRNVSTSAVIYQTQFLLCNG